MYSVLVCDDREVFRRQIKRLPYFKSPQKFEIKYEAEDGLEALDILHNNHVDVVLTDIRMPFIDGMELLKRVKCEQLCSCVILFSEFNEFSFARSGIINGAFDYIIKPLDNEKVTTAMDRAHDYLLELVSVSTFDSSSVENIANLIIKNAGNDALTYAADFVDRILAQCGSRAEINLTLNNALEQMAQLIIKRLCWVPKFVPMSQLCQISAGNNNAYRNKEDFLARIETILHEVNKFTINTKNQLVKNVCNYIIDNVENEITPQTVADEFFINKKYMSSLMKKELGITFVEYVTFIKIERAKVLLLEPDIKIGEVASTLNFSDMDYFSKTFKRLTTHSPTSYKRVFGL